MANNRELSQFASLITIDDSDRSIGINTSVGIGTTNPQATLHVVGDTLVTGVSTFNTDVYITDQLFVGGIEITGGGSAIGTDITTRNLNVTGISTLGIASASQLNITGVSTISVNSSSDALRITQEGSGNALVVEDSTNPDATPFVVNAAGSVGIGTTNPTVKLEVLASASGAFGSFTTPNNATSSVYIGNTLGDAVLYLLNDDQVSAGLGTLANNGSVINFSGKWTSATPSSNATFGAIGAYKENNTSNNRQGYLSLYTRPSAGNLVERVRIDSSGNVGIGTTNPLGTLQVNSGTSAVVVSAAGSVGIGNTNPAGKLTVVGGTTTAGGELNLMIRSSNPNIPATITGNLSSSTLQIFAGGMSSTSERGGQIDFVAGAATTDPGTLIFRTGTGTGGTSQPERVRIDASGNVGIGTTNPTSRLQVQGDALVSGVVTATTFIGALTGIAASATKLETPRTFEITGDVVATAISFDGTGNVSLAATIQPNSVGLGTDTTGDYVRDITGTSNQITVTSGTGEGSTPTLSIPNQFTPPQDVTVTRDLQVNRNLNVSGNITIGGTSATLFTSELKVYDPDLVLGFRTDAFGNDVSTDNTANHGGIAVASTEGTPLISLYDVGVGETNPATYKKFMWFKSGTFSGLGTDAWLSNYAIGIGSTQVPLGVRLAAGGMQVTDSTLSIPQLNVSGISTFTNGPVLVGTTTATGTASQPLQVTGGAYIAGDTINGVGLGIGVTNPIYPVDIRLNGLNTNTPQIRIYPTTGTRPASIVYVNGASSNFYTGLLNSVGSITTGITGLTPYAGIVGLSSGTTPLLLVTNALERVRIFDTGEVGIGTTNPSEATKLYVYDDNQNSNTYSSQVYRTSTNFSSGVGHRAYYESYYTTTQTSYASGINAQVSASVAAGVTNNGYIRGGLDAVWRNNNNAQSSTDNGKLNILYGRGIQYGHFNNNAVSPITNTVTGLYLTPYCLTGSIGTLIGLDINSVATAVGATATNVRGINCEIDTTDGTNPYNLYIGGNAQNYIAGSVGIGTTNPGAKLNVVDNSSSDALRITQLGTGNALVVEDSTSPDATPFVVSASGNVGIGTTNPTSLLRVLGQNNTTPVVIGAGNSATFSFSGDSSSGYTANFNINDTGLTIGHNSLYRDFRLQTNSLPRLTITAGGNVGIGTTNPITPLHISDGNGEISTALYTSDYAVISAQNTAPGFSFIVASSSSTAHRGVFKATRARGTLSSPTVPLVNDDTFSLLGAIYDGSTTRTTAAVNMEVDGTVGVGTAPQRITFWTGTGSSRLERVRIDSSGNVGIGTTNPQAKLHVIGDVLFNNTTAQGSVTSTGSTTSAIGIHSGLSTSTYRSVEYTIQATQGTNYHSTKILALHDGTTAYHSEYGTIYNNTSVATYDVDVSGGNIRLLATGASASSTNYVVNFVATKI